MTEVLTGLRNARERLARKNGWAQRTYGGPKGPNCLIGALILGFDPVGSSTYRIACEHVIMAAGLPPWGSLTGWNDAEDRTQAEVVKVCDDAIKLLEEQKDKVNGS